MSDYTKNTGMNADEPPPLPPKAVRRPAPPTVVDSARLADEPPPFPSRRVPNSSSATTAAPAELPSHAATASAARVVAGATAPRQELPSLRTRLIIGFAALCVVGLVAVGLYVFFPGHQKPIVSSQTKGDGGSRGNVSPPSDLGRPLQVSIGTTPPDNGGRVFNSSLLNVKCFATEDQLLITFDCGDDCPPNGIRLLVRLFDRNGQYLTHFITTERFAPEEFCLSTFTGLKPKGNRLVYPVNVRDLRDTSIVELGYFMRSL